MILQWLLGVRKRAEEAERLSDELKKKISELHLYVKSGKLSKDELASVERRLHELRVHIRRQIEHGTEKLSEALGQTIK